MAGACEAPREETMIACAQCKTTNTLDSVFCRRCCAALAADVLVEARAELDALVTKGTAAFEDGRVDDAMAIAEEAVLTDPTHANAHALKGMIHERRGEIAKALEEYERVCDLSPDSTLDRIRLSGLRSALAERATATSDRRTPLLAGVSAAVLLACVGIAAAKMMPAAKSAENSAPTGSNLVASSALPNRDDTSSATDRTVPNRPKTTLMDGDVAPVGAADAAGPAMEAPSLGASRGTSLPRAQNDRPSRMTGEIDISPMPINPGPIGPTLPNVNNGTSYPSQPPVARPRSIDPAPTAQDAPPVANNPAPRSTTKPKADGQIDIQIEKGSGNATEAGGNGAEALNRVAKAHAQGGDFDRAARAYERALAAGADPATTNQRLAQAYERMGRKNEAKQAYNRSADGYRKRMASGKGDDRDRNGLESVSQAMKVLDRG